MKDIARLFLLLSALTPLPFPALAADYVLTIKDHQFSPKTLEIPVNEKVKVTVRNLDSSAAEFESSDLNREKVVMGNGEISVFVGPLSAGNYAFFDDFHRSTTSGNILVK